jgi:hypothetical protein
MTSLSQTTPDDQMVPGFDQLMPAEPAADRAAMITADDPQSQGSAAWTYPATAAADSAADAPGAADGAEAGVPAAVPAPEPVREEPLASDGTSPGVRWHEIQAIFVDDPHSCLELAAGFVGDSVEALAVSLQERQQALRSAWQHDDEGTEELRIALQQYRVFWNRLEDLSREA